LERKIENVFFVIYSSVMFTNANNTEIHGLSEMSSTNDDQGALLNNEQRIPDDYSLTYRLGREYFL
jgi:hypothetical protein